MVQWWSKDTCTWYVTEVSTVRGVGERTIYGHIVAPLTGSIFPARLTIPCQAPELAPPHSNDDGWACLLVFSLFVSPDGGTTLVRKCEEGGERLGNGNRF